MQLPRMKATGKSVVEGEAWVVDWRWRSAGEGREMEGKKKKGKFQQHRWRKRRRKETPCARRCHVLGFLSRDSCVRPKKTETRVFGYGGDPNQLCKSTNINGGGGEGNEDARAGAIIYLASYA
ncbi:unnamed protein product [Prunus armeniaca]|uniref:Uncharacterized protein n=1 Tax=Prunus armeniaca TaxID=36596 RepID=A0A6J5X8U2_PRUAR|nr:unnamed protein product [Prunus armeniaca]CAB4309281.1 unnamed protein product [Prunus armeniaca]